MEVAGVIALIALGGWFLTKPKVPEEVDFKVRERVAELMARLRMAFPAVALPPNPEIEYVKDLRNAAGKPRNAGYTRRTNVLRLDADKVQAHLPGYLAQTLPHEIAHVLEETIDPSASHGEWWRQACEVLGVEPRVTYDHEADE